MSSSASLDEETEEMKRPVCTYKLTDGVKPASCPWGAIVRAPMEIVVPPKLDREIDLGVSFSMPALVFSHVDSGSNGLPRLLAPNESVKLTISNRASDKPFVIGEKSPVLFIVFVDPPELVQG